MPRNKTQRTKRTPWTPADLKRLSKLAGRVSGIRIARQLKRTEAAVRYKASTHRIRLRVKRK